MALSRSKTVCIKKAFQKAAPTVLTILSSVGVIATAVLSAKAAVRNRERVNNCKEYSDGEIEKFKEYIPAIVSGAATIACIFGANALSKRQRVQMAAAYTLLAQSYAKYKNKVVEMCGPETHRSIMNSIALEKARDISIYANTFAGSSTLGFDNMDDEYRTFYDAFGQRYFKSTFLKVLEAEYHLNRNFVLGALPTLNDFYDFLGIERTDYGETIGWTSANGDYYWIDFFHFVSDVDGTMECWVIDCVFPPEQNYLDI